MTKHLQSQCLLPEEPNPDVALKQEVPKHLLFKSSQDDKLIKHLNYTGNLGCFISNNNDNAAIMFLYFAGIEELVRCRIGYQKRVSSAQSLNTRCE